MLRKILRGFSDCVGMGRAKVPTEVRRKRNIMLSIYFGCAAALLYSISFGSIFDTYIYLKYGGSNSWVGYMEGVFGCSGIISALPVGYLVDYFNRVKIIKFGAFLFLGTLIFGSAVLLFHNTLLLLAFLLIFGVLFELINSACEAVFTDCVGPLLRVYYFTLKGSLMMVCYSMGPALCSIFFSFYGDEWKISFLRIPLLGGNFFFGVFCFIVLLLFYDLSSVSTEITTLYKSSELPIRQEPDLYGSYQESKMPHVSMRSDFANSYADYNQQDEFLGERGPLLSSSALKIEVLNHVNNGLLDYADDKLNIQNGVSQAAILHNHSSIPEMRVAEPTVIPSVYDSHGVVELVEENGYPPASDKSLGFDELLFENMKEELRISALSRLQNFLPFIIYFSDLIRSIGAGITLKYLSLFFMNDYNLFPTHVTAILAASGISTGLFISYSKLLSDKIGRTASVLVYNVFGIILVFVMVYVQNLPLLILVCVIRGGIQSSTFPINKSIIMDFTSTKYRGRWNAVETLVASLWSASAILGGFLADKYDYRDTFLITGLIYSVAFLVYIPVVLLLPASEDSRLLDLKPEFSDKTFF